MTLGHRPTAVIAEDEPVLARTLTRLLEQVWPELRIVGVAEDGLRATELALAQAPDVMFLDIKMPGRTGLEVAEAVADDWPDDRAEPLFVFITAYDSFAVAGLRARRGRLPAQARHGRAAAADRGAAEGAAGRTHGVARCRRPGRADAAHAVASRCHRHGRGRRAHQGHPRRRGQHRAHDPGGRRGLLRGDREVRQRRDARRARRWCA